MIGFNAQLVRLVRKHKKLSQQTLAERMGLPQTNVSAFERSESLNEATVFRVAIAMGFTMPAFYKLGLELMEKPR